MTDPDPGRSQLPALYTSPWSALGRDLNAVLASLRLKAQELWRRNRQADLSVPGFWPRALAPLFWPLLLLLALLGLAGVVVGLRALGPRAVPPAVPVAAPLQLPITPAGRPGQAAGLLHSPDPDSLAAGSPDLSDSPSSRSVASHPPGERPGTQSPTTPSSGTALPATALKGTSAPATPSTSARSAGAPSPSTAPQPSRSPSTPTSEQPSAPPTSPSAPLGVSPPDSALSDPAPPAIEPLLELLADLDPQQLIRAARPHPASGTLELELDARLDRLSAKERQQQANLWLERARALGYDNLELSDGDGLLLGRPAWVGGGMILLDHQAGG